MSELYVNDIELYGSYGFTLGANPGHATGPSLSDPTATVLGQLGPVWAGEPTQAAPRKLTPSGFVSAASASALKSAIDNLKALCYSGAVRLRFPDRTDQEFRDCRCAGFEVTPRAALMANLGADVSMTFDVADPIRYDINPLGYALSTSRTSLPMGTAPCGNVMIVLHGGGASLTNPTVTLKNAAGDTLGTIGLTASIGANDYALLDVSRVMLTKSVAGTTSDGLSWWTSGDLGLVFRPADGWYEASAWPTVTLSSTGGTAQGLISYSRGWL